METKEAIEFVRGIKHSGNGFGNSYISDFNKLKEVVTLLEQLENDCIELADENQMLKDHIKDLLE